jgi:hypothetical protein
MERNYFPIFAFNYLILLNLNTHVKIGYAFEFHIKIVILHWKYISNFNKSFLRKVYTCPKYNLNVKLWSLQISWHKMFWVVFKTIHNGWVCDECWL